MLMAFESYNKFTNLQRKNFAELEGMATKTEIGIVLQKICRVGMNCD